MAIYSLEEALKFIIQWEKKLGSFYDLMEDFLKDERARRAVKVLKQEQYKTLDALQQIDLNEYKHTEYMKNVPSFNSADISSSFEISAEATAKDIFEIVLSKEEALAEYYKNIRNVLAYKKSQDLLDMLIKFKMGQIKKIQAYMESYDLVM